ncbi:hypothetical protein EE612_013278, partial [Oryza sativa]
MFVFTAMAWTGWFYSCKRGGWGHDEAAQINWSRVGEMMGGWQLPVRWRCHRAMVWGGLPICWVLWGFDIHDEFHPPCGLWRLACLPIYL